MGLPSGCHCLSGNWVARADWISDLQGATGDACQFRTKPAHCNVCFKGWLLLQNQSGGVWLMVVLGCSEWEGLTGSCCRPGTVICALKVLWGLGLRNLEEMLTGEKFRLVSISGTSWFLAQMGCARDKATILQSQCAENTAVPTESCFLSYTGHLEVGFIKGSNETIHMDQRVCVWMLRML